MASVLTQPRTNEQGIIRMSELNLSKRTLQILKNFATINPAVVLEAGSTLRTADPGQSILVIASIDEKIPVKFPIMELSSFLGILGLPAFSECTLNMGDRKIEMVGKKTSMNFWAAAESLVELPEEELELGEGDIKAVMEEGAFADLKKACSYLGHEFCKLSNRGGKVYFTALSPAVDTSNNYEVELGTTDQPDAELILKTDNLKMIPGDYKIEASSENNFVKFTTMDDRILYLVGAELQ